MKNIIRIIYFLIIFFSVNVYSQTINSVCAIDSIRLNAENHQFGMLQWEKSVDSINWEPIENANDLSYQFLPKESAYYRVANKFSNCDPQYSPVTLVQTKPTVSITKNRVVNGDFVYLVGNKSAGANGFWTLLEGEGGTIENPESYRTKFTATEGTYKLKYTLVNDCGMDSDTVQVRFSNPVFYEKIVVIDETDLITSTEEELQQGIYKVTFNDPVPSIDNETFLVGMIENGFLRKVVDVTQNDNNFIINTSNALLDDILVSGTLDLSMDQEMESIYEGLSRGAESIILTTMPTRKELLTDSRFKSGNRFIYRYETKSSNVLKGVELLKNNNTNKGSNEPLGFNYKFKNVKIKLEQYNNFEITTNGGINIIPNFTSIVDFSEKYAKIGLDNLEYNVGVDYNVIMNFDDLLKLEESIGKWEYTSWHFPPNSPPIQIVWGIDLKVEGNIEPFVGGIDFGLYKSGNVRAVLEYNDGLVSADFWHHKKYLPIGGINLNAGFKANLSFGPEFSAKVYGGLGPYFYLNYDNELEMAFCQNAGIQTKHDISLKGKLGMKGEIFDFTLFDVARDFIFDEIQNYQTPSILDYISGNNQIYTVGQPIELPLKILTKSSDGSASSNVKVKFEVLDGNDVLFHNTLTSNSSGSVEYSFTPTTTNISQVKVSAFDCDGEHLSGSPFMFNLRESGGSICLNSSLYASIIKTGNTIQPKAHLGAAPYTYSTDGINFTSDIPQINSVVGIVYDFYVKDRNGCVAFTSHTREAFSCKNTDLVVNYTQYGNTIKAEGFGGTPPYQYALVNHTPEFGTSNIFLNVSPHKWLLRVKDANGCISNTVAEVNNNTNKVVAYFELPKNIHAGQPIFFSNLSNNATSYSWNFSNGTTSIQVNPSTVFLCNRTYLVSLTASDGTNSHTFRREITITDGQICTVIDIQNNVYNVVKIGDQLWMKENLKTAKLNDGTPLTYASSVAIWEPNADTTPLYANTPIITSPIYGYLYNWATINTNKLCPTGWRVPNNDDWDTLLDFLFLEGFLNYDNASGIGNILKSCKQVNAPDPNCISSTHPRWNSSSANLGLDSYGFSGLPAGRNNAIGQYGNYGIDGYWWSNNEVNANMASVRGLLYNSGALQIQSAPKNNGLSVRCIKE